jgi:hypothetical protein
MKYYVLFIATIFVSCNSNGKNKKQSKNTISSDKCFDYPREIDSLKIQDLYDTARWYVYTRYCDVFYQPKSDSLSSKRFGQLELKFDNLFKKNDTVSLFFDFIDKGKIILSGTLRDNLELATGIAFDLKTRKKIFIISSNVSASFEGDSKNRYINAMQPEVVNYMLENWENLNDCFKELAHRKGLK